MKAKVEPVEAVNLWLGANVMLEYSLEDATHLLVSLSSQPFVSFEPVMIMRPLSIDVVAHCRVQALLMSCEWNKHALQCHLRPLQGPGRKLASSGCCLEHLSQQRFKLVAARQCQSFP